ncbi:unnamed protein product [Didymodactylos carnosus]|uniref:CCHC-type domain-containing protein n=1 Tax=Didymodactylos carnosus TaxID=1234261 RepID=A0A815V0H9_9BILA|nr:unnamed protein product [Didymodactylos carnosus]CAF4382601.1 unnamed protein product [Didymodactylos carnosus]
MSSNAHLRNPRPIRVGSPSAILLPSTKPESLSAHPSSAIQINQTVSSADVPSQMRPAPQTVIIPAPTTIPQYSGTPSEKPLQFLLRLQHFASSMYGWTDTVLLQGISTFLQDTALDWYTQLSLTHALPTTWSEFQHLFIEQFTSPLRLAQTEEQWNHCVQRSDEPISQFLVRLRGIWYEAKPTETEHDLIQHLYAKMRPDLATFMGVLEHPTLNQFMDKARSAEKIIFSMQQQQRTLNQSVAPATSVAVSDPFPASVTRRTSDGVCYNCKKPGHYSYHCRSHPQSPYRKN